MKKVAPVLMKKKSFSIKLSIQYREIIGIKTDLVNNNEKRSIYNFKQIPTEK